MNTELENSIIKIWAQDQQTEINNTAEKIKDACGKEIVEA